ncbi:MAG: isoaspartyl peptidase/L-asparaginase, partial [Bacteroidota bacterium]
MSAIIVHAGAWDIPDDRIQSHKDGCLKALLNGWNVLKEGGSAEEAVEEAIKAFEDNPEVDSGRGSGLNATGIIEMDASMMNGTTFRAGAVAAVRNILNPISLARKVMNESEHVLLVGEGANQFAREVGIQECSADELVVERERKKWLEFTRDRRAETIANSKDHADTVGAVALDSFGTIVAGTSTGGTPQKLHGRVGDSPLIGCGTYADSSVGGISCSGRGENIIKVVLAKTVIDFLAENGGDPQRAAEDGISLLDKKVKGTGGVILIGRGGKVGCAYNTPRFAHTYLTSEMGEPVVA